MKNRRTRRSAGPKAETPHPIDVHVGWRMRLRRVELGVSQEKLAAALGITFQQVQKYERAANRISASRLFRLAQLLEVPVQFFFDEMGPTRRASVGRGPPAEMLEPDPLCSPEAIEFIHAFRAINDLDVRHRLYQLLQSLARQTN